MSSLVCFHTTKHITIGCHDSSMVDLFRGDLSSITTSLGVVIAAIAVIGTTTLGWEWGASFAEQPIPFVLGVCAVAVVILSALYRRVRG